MCVCVYKNCLSAGHTQSGCAPLHLFAASPHVKMHKRSVSNCTVSVRLFVVNFPQGKLLSNALLLPCRWAVSLATTTQVILYCCYVCCCCRGGEGVEIAVISCAAATDNLS